MLFDNVTCIGISFLNSYYISTVTHDAKLSNRSQGLGRLFMFTYGCRKKGQIVRLFYTTKPIYSQTCIYILYVKATQGNLKMWPL